uniref:Uncharacterized protein n=1 Tax=Phaeomonas parva TaxID=124430 RepID=A0A7S1XQ95_9STRA
MQRTYSIEDFEQPDGCVPINSPRTQEACLRVGISAHELMPVDESFYRVENDTEASLTLKREHYQRKRDQKIEMVREQRNHIIEFLETQNMGLRAEQPVGVTLPATIKKESASETAAKAQAQMVDLERKRFASMVKRQKKELDRLVENEKIMMMQQQKIVAADEAEAKRRKEHEEMVAARQAESAAKRQAISLEKKYKADEELRKRKKLAKEEAAREKVIQQMEKEERARWRREAERREEQRRAKLAEHARKSALALAEQERRAEESRKRMERKEAMVKAMMEEKRRKKAIEVEQRQKRAEQRIKSALDRQREIQEEKKRKFDEKEKAAAERAAEIAEIDREKTAKLKEENDAKMAARQDSLRGCYQEQLDRRRRIIQRMRGREHYKNVVAEERARYHHTLKTKHDLQLQDHLENVERIRRVDDYTRLKLMRKIEDEDERFEHIKEERQFLIESRKEMGHQAFLRKFRMNEAIDRMRITNKMDKSLDSIVDGGGKSRRRKKNAVDGEGEG